ncbi:hypothetical protein E1A40_08825 [Salmonella enterica subsp. enterica serovar Aba]|nr:hypothetical protein [Salmonella enterica]EBR4546821.1 hypothetical protein [Salmonella enterica]EBX2183606.1 hypothetical protein [Salmonella enterica subsp. enterica serovar Aba]ECG5317609.1 hypothetical protein [Salmonella enterica subsp. enterica serovar Aba]
MKFTKEQLIKRIEKQVDINATIIERLSGDSAAVSELAVKAATMDMKILDITLSVLMAENFIGVDPAFGPDRTVEVRYFAPPGYAMVPKEPTPKQWAAGLKAMNEGVDKVSLVYGAMLSAAPQVLPEVSGE